MDIGVETGVLVAVPFDEQKHQDIPGSLFWKIRRETLTSRPPPCANGR